MYKRIMAFTLTAAMTLPAISGCKKNGADSAEVFGNITTTDEYPQKTDVTLRYWLPLHSHVSATATGLNDTPFKEYLEEQTGINVKFEHPVAGQQESAFNIMIASDDMPDIIEWNWSNYNGGAQKAIDDDVIEPLNKYINSVSPNLKKIFDEHPEYRRQTETESGEVYQYPMIRGDERLASYMALLVRQDLLDEAGLEKPATYDDWETMLYKFKQMGVKSPLSLRLNNLYLETLSPFTSRFGFIADFYHDEKGNVLFGPYQKEFADYIKMLNRWYNDGILDTEFANTEKNRRVAMVANGENGAIDATIGGDFGSFIGAILPESGIHYTAVTFPVNKAGERPMYAQKDWQVGDGAAISATSKYKELAARLLDFGYSDEGHILYNFGKEGVSFEYRKEENGSVSPIYTDIITDPWTNGGLTMAQSMARYLRANYGGPFVQDIRYTEQYYTNEEQKKALDMTDSDAWKYKLPNMTYTQEEQKKLSDILTPIYTYREETVAKLISGKLDISYLDEYFQKMKDMGIEEAISIKQHAYDRYTENAAK